MAINFFDEEKYVLHYENFQLYLGLRLKLKILLELNQSQWWKPYIEFNTQKRIKAGKHRHKDGKALDQLMKNAIYGKTLENLRNRIDVRLLNNKKTYLKWTSKPSYMSYINAQETSVHSNVFCRIEKSINVQISLWLH